ncbi:hypothetical protein THEYE_A2032 [Thermodesulfovibrio yellowstonii DSM 11347]|uniref:Uncharacterized protein n=1 Tax=Thermodesulfovibrio yellowstonii (strain ATCC 51303 / DSM 11347 / YP87) TaxID=289376 RepID=B5YIU5_THEYD|nr:hypothetical protein THEYE_A2032 [Thermodesulfovibrio yellowstonii DSM 11347]
MQEFHLNHVGYKGLCYREFARAGWEFHLNHVGYKVFRLAYDAVEQYKFHLNHVGYKGMGSNVSTFRES